MKKPIKVIAASEYRGMGDGEIGHKQAQVVKAFSAYQCVKSFFPEAVEGMKPGDFEEYFMVLKSGPFIIVCDNDGEYSFTFVKLP